MEYHAFGIISYVVHPAVLHDHFPIWASLSAKAGAQRSITLSVVFRATLLEALSITPQHTSGPDN